MSDLTDRLQDVVKLGVGWSVGDLEEAADRIEHLEAALTRLGEKEDCFGSDDLTEELIARIDYANEALRRRISLFTQKSGCRDGRVVR